MTDRLIIRTSDRQTFHRCRQLWQFTSKIQMDYEPVRPKDYFEFGTAWHAAMEAWYAPERGFISEGADRAPFLSAEREESARFALRTTNESQRRRLEELGHGGPDTDEEYSKREDLGQRMLSYFIPWSRLNDDFEPITVEHEFEVPIGTLLDGRFVPGTDSEYLNGSPVVYQGRIDGLVRDFAGNYWLLEHKTASKEGGTNWLAMDPQTGSYSWAFKKMLDVPILGVIRTVAYKRCPERPRILKDGSVSVDKRQNTTASLFLEAVQEAYPFQPAHQTVADTEKYLDYHAFLSNPDIAPKYVERHQLQRNPDEIENIGREIALDAEDMLSSPNITRSVSPMNCNPCAFYGPCLAKWENQDYQMILDSEFMRRGTHG